MVKLALIASLFCLVCCTAIQPVYNVGDCIIFTYENGDKLEKWEEPNTYVYKILEIGESHYRVKLSRMRNNSIENSFVFESTLAFVKDSISKKINCPTNF